MNDVKVDWSDAPEGATDFNIVNEMWYKEEAGVMWYWSMHRTCWVEGAERGGYSNNDGTTFISRPKEVKSMIGKISGKDWSEAPDDATHVAKNIKGNFANFYKYENGEWYFAEDKDDSYLTSANSSLGWFNPISKEDDLQLETKPKYSSLQELPVGTFVKWTGDNYYQIYIKGKVREEGMVLLECTQEWSDLGESVAINCFHLPRCTYSDKYGGEYIPFVEEQPAQVTPQAIKDGWKIKHIKHPDYKCGRDVAVTILYREAGSHVFEYKYAVCSPKEMFSRKAGIQEALDKKESWHIQTSKDILFREILSDICKVPRVYTPTPEFKLLKLWHDVNH